MRPGDWRIVLSRSRADRLIVAAAWVVIVAASTLLSAGVVYSEAVARSGLLRALAAAPATEAGIRVTTRVGPSEADATVERVDAEIAGALTGADPTIFRVVRSGSFALPDQPSGEVTDLTVIAWREGIEAHAGLVSGGWPSAGSDPMETVLSEPAAKILGAGVGDELVLTDRLDAGRTLAVRISGIYRVNDPADPYWWNEPLQLQGTAPGASFTTFGPFLAARDDVLARGVSEVAQLVWHAVPAPGAIDAAEVTGLRRHVAALPDRLEAAVEEGSFLEVETELPAILQRAGASLLVSGTGVLLLDIQLAVLAGYALVLIAGLIIERRRAETALLRARGASSARLASLSVAEGLVLVVPAALVGPPLALVVVALFEGSLGVGVPLRPTLGPSAMLVSAGAAVVSLCGLAVPAVVAAGSLASVRRAVGRQLDRTFAHRIGLDIALVVLAALGLWQLGRYGAPLTRSLRGSLGADPLLVVAPAVGLLAGAVLALRVVPRLASGLQAILARRPGLVPVLGARQLARRPLRYTRAALLLIVSIAVAFFAGGYSGTWLQSQHDQVDHAVGTDVRVTAAARPVDPAWITGLEVGSLPGVRDGMAVVREGFDLGPSGGRGTLIGVERGAADSIVAFRPDRGDAPLGALMDRLGAAAAADGPVLPRLPEGTARVALDVELALTAAREGVYPDEVPATWNGLAAGVVVRDATGALVRFTGAETTFANPARPEVRLSVERPDGTTRVPRAPLDVVGLELDFRVPDRVRLTGTVTLTRVWTSTEASGDDWQPFDLDHVVAGWRYLRTAVAIEPAVVPAGADAGAFEVGDEAPLVAREVVRFGLRPPQLAGRAPAVHALASDGLQAATATPVGGTTSIAERFRTPRTVTIVGGLRGFPTVATDEAVVVADIGALALHDYGITAEIIRPQEWWLRVAEGAAPAVQAAVAAEPYSAQGSVARETELGSRLTDPIALGVIGALSLGGTAAAFFAAVGFLVSAAVGARERITEFALLHALGLTRRQLSTWLALENAFLLGVSLVAGVALGALLAWVVLPSVTLTPAATTVVPPVLVRLPWDVALALALLTIALLAVAVAFLGLLLRRAGLGRVLRLGDE